MNKSAFALAVGLALGAGTMWFFLNPGNYEQCILNQMQGQDKSMQYVAEKLCQKRFKVEVPVYGVKSDSWKWSTIGSLNFVTINSEEYDFTRGEFKFSKMKCDVSKSEDFSIRGNGSFIDNRSTIVLDDDAANSESPKCIRLENLWGKYK